MQTKTSSWQSAGPGVVHPGDEEWMRVALEQAGLATSHGDVPVGCVVVSATGQVLAVGRNRREVDSDPTAHAEIVALREASLRLGRWHLDGSVVYVTLEPCAMCAGALVNARIGRLVYGADDPKAGAVTSLFGIGTDSRLNHRFAVCGGVLVADVVAQLRAFFAARRGADPCASKGLTIRCRRPEPDG